MKKSFLFSAIIVAVLFTYNSVLAQDFTKVGVIDLQRCIRESKEGQKVSQILQKKKDDLQKKLDKKQREILELRKELDKQSMMLSMDAQEGKKRTIERRTRELEYLYKDLNEELVRLQEKEKQRIFKELEEIIKKIGSEENYTLIMAKRAGGVMYSTESIDITDQVIKAYDKTNEANN